MQIKATQGKSVALRHMPQHLIVLKLMNSGDCDEIYNGSGELPWSLGGKLQSNGRRSISLTKLKALMGDVSGEARIRQVGA